MSRCRFDKHGYNAEKAQAVYRETLVDSRIGVDLTSSEAKALADTIAPLLRQGPSPYQIGRSPLELTAFLYPDTSSIFVFLNL